MSFSHLTKEQILAALEYAADMIANKKSLKQHDYHRRKC